MWQAQTAGSSAWRGARLPLPVQFLAVELPPGASSRCGRAHRLLLPLLPRLPLHLCTLNVAMQG